MEDFDEDIPWAHVRRVQHLVDNPPRPTPAALPVEIAPWLCLSDWSNARCCAKIRAMGITHVLSVNDMAACVADEMRDDLRSLGINHKHVGCEDEEGYDMISERWGECREYLKSARDGGGKALVHCFAGINRSGLVACAARMVLERRTVLEVVEDCVRRRGTVLWNRSFQVQLCVLAAKEGLLGEKPVGYSDEPPNAAVDPPPTSGF